MSYDYDEATGVCTWVENGKTIEQHSEVVIHTYKDIDWPFTAYYFICDGKRFETAHDLQCYIDPAYVRKLAARSKKSRKPVNPHKKDEE